MRVGQSLSTFEEFASKFDVQIRFSKDQYRQFEKDIPVVLTAFQLDELVEQVSEHMGLADFLEDNAPQISPVCMSLFVLNEATWALMNRKPWDKNKMLAMTTLPHCSWDRNEESTSNPKSVKRWDLGQSTLAFGKAPPTLNVSGDGGDFSGFIEQSMLTARKFGMPETRGLVPNYQFKKLEIAADLKDARIHVHPEPADEFDYDYSASAKTFYNHGIDLELDGESVTLQVGKQNPSKLRGRVHLLVGVPNDAECDPSKELLADIWFRVLHRLAEAER
ncbi:MAG: hypothetical protein ACFE8Z_00365 [Candidatus Hermodarchaeota archaeon]